MRIKIISWFLNHDRERDGPKFQLWAVDGMLAMWDQDKIDVKKELKETFSITHMPVSEKGIQLSCLSQE